MKNKILIGIDAGVKTGFAVSLNGTLRQAKTLSIIEAMEEVRKTALSAKRSTQEYEITVFIEDARKRKWVTGGREKLQGVGQSSVIAKFGKSFANTMTSITSLSHQKTTTPNCPTKHSNA